MAVNLSLIGGVLVLCAVFVWRFALDPLTLGFEGPPDTIFYNAVIWTAESSGPVVEAVAVENGRIVQLGTSDQIKALAGKDTKKMDLGGAFVTPGFIDSHVHFIASGGELTQLDLRECKGREDMAAMVAKKVKESKDGSVWIRGWGWKESTWGGEMPTLEWLDGAAPKNPVWLARIDGHAALANSAALAVAKVDASTPDPPGGTFIRWPDGTPTGLLKDAAMAAVTTVIPPPSPEDRRHALDLAMDQALAHGVTSVTDMGNYVPGLSPDLSWSDLTEVYDWADKMGRLRMRINVLTPLPAWKRTLALVKERGKRASQWLQWGCLKEFADGSLGSRTALFYEPYADSADDYGLPVASKEYLREAVGGATAEGLQVTVHAIGDKAVDIVLDVYGEIIAEYSGRDLRLRVEHMQHISEHAAERAGRLKIISSVQPQHAVDDASVIKDRLGMDRYLRSYAFHSLLKNGSTLALGSDWSVAPLDPLGGMTAAVRRKPEGWKKPFNPKEALSAPEALLGYTKAGAYASFWDDEIGSLAPGKLADFVVLSRSPIDALESYAAMPVILRTYVGGALAYQKGAAEVASS